jgi:hypothetical protein
MDIVAIATLIGVAVSLLLHIFAYYQRERQIKIQDQLLKMKQEQVGNDISD